MNIVNKWILPGVKCWLDVSKSQPDICYSQVEIISIESAKKIVIKTLTDNKVLETESQNLLERNEDIQNVHGLEDLVHLSVLNEPEILNNLYMRYHDNIIFTSIGPTLLVMNPYKELHELFNETMMKEYRRKTETPHIYQIAYLAYAQLLENSKNQAIVISGESGAGKTETTKHAMKFLTSGTFSCKLQNEDTPIEEKILRCNPILEAFGNSKTVRNDNSSRFGKFVRLLINKNSKSIHGATITSYLLEKSRLTTPSKGERNFHIFYHLLEGCDIKDMALFGLLDNNKNIYKADSFEYLRKSQCYSVAKINDKELFQEVIASFNKTGFKNTEIKGILKILSAILHMGNLSFDNEKLTDIMPCTIKEGNITLVAQMLLIPETALLKALVFKTREIQGQIIESPQPLTECHATRDSLSKYLYEKLFNWLVKRLNLVIFPPEEVTNLRKVRKSIKSIRDSLTQIDGLTSSIGLLDIFGFENFENNSFEQLCINFTNERLQQLYVSYVFKAEEKELIDQGLQSSLNLLTYQDNAGVIELLDKYPSGIYDLLDESSSLGSGTDEFLLQKIIKTHGKNTFFTVPKQNKSNTFVVIHTAKPVEYDIRGFRAKNKDEISNAIQLMLSNSKDELLNELIQNIFINSQEKKKVGSVGVSKSEKFLGAKFRNQMKELMFELFNCEVHFIRCIKPNELKKEGLFNSDFVLLQIRYLGLLDSIKIRKQGYPLRKDYIDFYKKYIGIFGRIKEDISIPIKANVAIKNIGVKDIYIKDINGKETGVIKAIKALIHSYFEKNNRFSSEIGKKILFGNSKIYLKQDILDYMDDRLLEIWKKKILVGKRVRKQYICYIFRKKVKIQLKRIGRIFKAICIIQARYKGKRVRARFLRKKLAVIKINKRLKQIFIADYYAYFKKKTILMKKIKSFIFGFKKLISLKPLKSTVKQCFFTIKELNSNKTKSKALEKNTVLKTNNPIKLEEMKKNSEKAMDHKVFPTKPPDYKPNPLQETSKLTSTIQPSTQNPSNNSNLIGNNQPIEKLISNNKSIEKTNINDNPIKNPTSNNYSPENLTSSQCDENSTNNKALPSEIPANLKKSAFFDNKKPEKFLTVGKEKDSIDENSDLYIDLRYISKTETKRLSFQPLEKIDPRNFAKAFIDYSANLKQDNYSPLHHYTLYGSNHEPESVSFSFIPVSNDCFNNLTELDPSFLRFLKETDWKSVVDKLLNKKRAKANTFELIMNHTKKMMKHPLQNLNSKYTELSLKLFKYILQCSLERKTKFTASVQIRKILKILIQAKEPELIDEFFLQVMKQLISCFNDKTLEKLLSLLGTISSIIAITPRLFMPFLAFLYQNINSEYNKNEDILQTARFCFLRIKSLFEVGSRDELPLDNELFLVENRKQIIVPINFLLGNHIFIYVESYTTVKEAIIRALAKLGLMAKAQYFGLYQVKKTEDPITYEERFLDDSTKIMDILTKCELEPKKKSSETKLYLRQRVFYIFYSNDLDSVEMLYSHFVYEVLRGRLDVDENTAITLGSLSLVVDHGDFSKEKARFLKINIQRYIPEKFLSHNSPQVWIDKILINYLKIKTYDRTIAKLAYLDQIKDHQFFFAEKFNIEYSVLNLDLKGDQTQKKARNLLFALKPACISFYDDLGEKLTLISNYHIKDIKSWGMSEKTMILVETNDNVKHLIRTERCGEINYLIKKYLDMEEN